MNVDLRFFLAFGFLGTLLLSNISEVSAAPKKSDLNCVKELYEPREYTSFDLFFSKTFFNSVACKASRNEVDVLPSTAYKALKKQEDSFTHVIAFDLNSDGVNEYIVQGSEPSGGTQFYFLQKQNNKWKLITYISGGFVLGSSYDVTGLTKQQKKYEKITYWHRYGMRDTHQYELVYKSAEYKQINDGTIPEVLLTSHDFLELMRELNGFNSIDQWN